MLVERGSNEERIKESEKVLKEFYSRETGKYFINFSLITEEVITSIISQMQNGAVLGIYNEDETELSYVLSKEDSAKLRNIEATKGKLASLLSEKKYSYFESVKIPNYLGYAEAIDHVLLASCCLDNYVDDWAIVLTVEGGKFVFKECFSYCY